MISTICCIHIPVLTQSFIRVIFTLPMILIIPGYVLIATLFPDKKDPDSIERLVKVTVTCTGPVELYRIKRQSQDADKIRV